MEKESCGVGEGDCSPVLMEPFSVLRRNRSMSEPLLTYQCQEVGPPSSCMTDIQKEDNCG